MLKGLSTTKIISLVIVISSVLYLGVEMAYRNTSQVAPGYQEGVPETPSRLAPTKEIFPSKRTVPTLPAYVARQPQAGEELEWGVAKEVDEGTYTIRVGQDDNMATPQEVHEALNKYREVNGRSRLDWSDSLANYAQTRAQRFEELQSTDKHEGFNNYLENNNGFGQLGYRRLGENSYYGGKLQGVHLIEWVFAQSPGHNANQLDQGWSHVGIGVTVTSVDLIFGGEKM